MHLEGSSGQREARKRFVQSNPEVQAALDEGKKVWIAAIPTRSFQPSEVVIEQPPPRLHV